MLGIIALWSGAVVDIPIGWQICDGTNGTPDLQNKMVVCAGDIYAVDDSGGDVSHTHNFTGDGHTHSMAAIRNINLGPTHRVTPSTESITGETDTNGTLPPYHALAYIGWVGQ